MKHEDYLLAIANDTRKKIILNALIPSYVESTYARMKHHILWYWLEQFTSNFIPIPYTTNGDFVNLLRLKFPDLKRMDELVLRELIEIYDYQITDSGVDPLNEIKLILTYPQLVADYDPKNTCYSYNLLISDLEHYLLPTVKKLTRQLLKRYFEVKGKINTTEVSRILNTVYFLKEIKQTEVEPFYWDCSEDLTSNEISLESIIAMGVTHRQIFESGLTDYSPKVKTFVLNSINKSAITRVAESRIRHNHELRRFGESLGCLFKQQVNSNTAPTPIARLRDVVFGCLDRATHGFPNGDSYFYSDVKQLFTTLPPSQVNVALLELYRWTQYHKQFTESTRMYYGKNGEEIAIHTHTVLLNIIRAITDQTESKYEGLITVSTTPSELLEIYSSIIQTCVEQQISEKIVFPDIDLTISDQVTAVGETLSFIRLSNSIELKSEGVKMRHCIGGYGEELNNKENIAFHVNSSSDKFGYTIHLAKYDPTTDDSIIRGIVEPQDEESQDKVDGGSRWWVVEAKGLRNKELPAPALATIKQWLFDNTNS